MRYQIIEFPTFIDTKGTLTPFEFNDAFPFEVKRVYSVTGREGVTRGAHAHLIESEVFVVLTGSVMARVDDGENVAEISLDQPGKALYVKDLCWHEFYDFSENAVLLCFSSTHYLPGESNYITEKSKFYERLKIQ